MRETLDDLFAVIVFYKISLEQSPTFSSLLKAAQTQPGKLHILLYNNFPPIKLNTDLYTDSKIICSVINDEDNSGVSKAFNIACKRAQTLSKTWLVLLDQDTEIPGNFFEEFFIQRNNVKNETCKLYVPVIYSANKIVSPAKYIPYRGIILKNIKHGFNSLRKFAVINSGVIIHTSLFEEAGGYNEAVNLDFSDISFFRRVKRFTKDFFIMHNVKCLHMFSGFENDNLEKNLNRFKIFVTNAAAFCKEKGVSKIYLFVTVFIRAFYLSARFKTKRFFSEIRL